MPLDLQLPNQNTVVLPQLQVPQIHFTPQGQVDYSPIVRGIGMLANAIVSIPETINARKAEKNNEELRREQLAEQRRRDDMNYNYHMAGLQARASGRQSSDTFGNIQTDESEQQQAQPDGERSVSFNTPPGVLKDQDFSLEGTASDQGGMLFNGTEAPAQDQLNPDSAAIQPGTPPLAATDLDFSKIPDSKLSASTNGIPPLVDPKTIRKDEPVTQTDNNSFPKIELPAFTPSKPPATDQVIRRAPVDDTQPGTPRVGTWHRVGKNTKENWLTEDGFVREVATEGVKGTKIIHVTKSGETTSDDKILDRHIDEKLVDKGMNPDDYGNRGEKIKALAQSDGSFSSSYDPQAINEDGVNPTAIEHLPKGDQDIVKKIADYKMAPPGSFALRSPQWKKIVEALAAYDPTYDAKEYPAKSKLRNDFTSGQSARNIRSLNTAIGHLDTLKKSADDLQNTDYPLLNKGKNFLSSESGSGKVVKFNDAANALVNELAAVFKGTGAPTAQEVTEWRKALNASQSPEQLNEGIKQVVELMKSRMDALRGSYETGMAKPKDFHFLNDKSQKILKKLGVNVDEVDPVGRKKQEKENQTYDEATQAAIDHIKANPDDPKSIRAKELLKAKGIDIE